MDINIDQLKDLLKTSILNVTFIKKDGTTRIMRSTLQSHLLPVIEQKETTKEKKLLDNNLVVVYDIENNGFRSFHFNSVSNIEIIE